MAGWLKLGVALVCMTSFIGPAAAQAPDNLQLLTALADSLIGQEVAPFLSSVEGAVLVNALDRVNPHNWFVESRLISVLRRHGVSSIYLNPETLPSGDGGAYHTLEYKLLDMVVEYFEPGAGSVKGLRRAKLGFYVRVVRKPSGKVIKDGYVRGHKSDRISKAERALFANGDIPLRAGKTEPKTSNTGYFQPALVVGVSGLIVYLFFSQRSR